MIKRTTVLAVLNKEGLAMGGDGQVTMGDTVMKGNAQKVRKMYDGKVLSGFAGATADSFALFEKFEGKLNEYSGDLARAAVELAKEWRLDKILRRLEALLIVADRENMFLISGTGDVIKPEEDGLLAIGTGGAFAKAAAKAFIKSGVKMTPKEIVLESLKIAASLCIYTNDKITVEELT